MNADLLHELTRRDHYALACGYWLRLVEKMDARALGIWLAGLTPPLEQRSDEAIAFALFRKVGEYE